jgi:hypothetical protein
MEIFRLIWRLASRVVAVASGTLSVLGATVFTDIPFDSWLVVAFVVAAFLAWLDQYLIAQSYVKGDRRLTTAGVIVFPSTSAKGVYVMRVEVLVTNLGAPVILSDKWEVRVKKAGAKRPGKPIPARDVMIRTDSGQVPSDRPILTTEGAYGPIDFALEGADTEYADSTVTITGRTIHGQVLTSPPAGVKLQNPPRKAFVV